MLLLPLEMPGPFRCCSRLSQLTGQEKVGPPFAAGKPHGFSGLETEFRQRHFPAGLDVFGREYGAGPHRRSDERPATATSPQPHPETTGKSADGSARSTGLAGAFAEPVSFPSHLALTLLASGSGSETGKRNPGQGLAHVPGLPLLMGTATARIPRELTTKELMRQKAIADPGGNPGTEPSQARG